MPQIDVQSSNSHWTLLAARLRADYGRALQRIPRKLRLAVLTASIVLVGIFFYTVLFRPSATLNVVCRHNLRNAELSVLIDGKLAHTEQISGTARKRFGLFDTRIEGAFSKSLSVPAGQHVVQVRLRSEGFDQAKVCGVNLVTGKDATVLVSAQRGGMTLVYQGPPVTAGDSPVSDYFSSVRTLVAALIGSAASAVIGFVVQEALRARKSATVVANQNS